MLLTKESQARVLGDGGKDVSSVPQPAGGDLTRLGRSLRRLADVTREERRLLDQKVVDQALHVDPFGEEALGAGHFNGMRTHSGGNREPENLNEREFSTY